VKWEECVYCAVKLSYLNKTQISLVVTSESLVVKSLFNARESGGYSTANLASPSCSITCQYLLQIQKIKCPNPLKCFKLSEQLCNLLADTKNSFFVNALNILFYLGHLNNSRILARNQSILQVYLHVSINPSQKNGFCQRFNGRQPTLMKIPVRTPQLSTTPLLSVLTQKLV
jgi:hypothetical protein